MVRGVAVRLREGICRAGREPRDQRECGEDDDTEDYGSAIELHCLKYTSPGSKRRPQGVFKTRGKSGGRLSVVEYKEVGRLAKKLGRARALPKFQSDASDCFLFRSGAIDGAAGGFLAIDLDRAG
jgi:hypothetical protein